MRAILAVSFSNKKMFWWILYVVALSELNTVNGHGRLMDPPARNSMWRFGYSNPVNWDDNQNWCGGAAVMINQNGGKCGICGDNYADPKPRDHENGGMYANGIIVRRYAPGQILDLEVELTANHQGTFEFKICPSKDPVNEVTQECLDSNTLKVIDESGKTVNKYTIVSKDKKKTFFVKAKLPPYLSCSHCVLQWTYVAANTWGPCPNGTEAVGCGPQETFVNCADVAIIPNNSGFPPLPPPENLVYIAAKTGNTSIPLVVRSQVCLATDNYARTEGMNEWCQTNCVKYPPNCPPQQCKCRTECNAIGPIANTPGADVHCLHECMSYSSVKNDICPLDKCMCQ